MSGIRCPICDYETDECVCVDRNMGSGYPKDQPTPVGYVLVPIVPTDEMLENAVDYMNSAMSAEAIWRVMVAAAPDPTDD